MVIIVKAGKQHGYGETLVSNAQTEKEQGKKPSAELLQSG